MKIEIIGDKDLVNFVKVYKNENDFILKVITKYKWLQYSDTRLRDIFMIHICEEYDDYRSSKATVKFIPESDEEIQALNNCYLNHQEKDQILYLARFNKFSYKPEFVIAYYSIAQQSSKEN